MSMLNTGISGLSAAQVQLNTIGNNISNANTDGYSRQLVSQADRVLPGNGRYTVGGGVDVAKVQRAYSDYLTSAMWTSNAGLQRASTTNDLASALNNALASSGDLQGALDNLYGGFSAVANAPSDSSARQALLGSASSLAAVFNTLGQQFASQQKQINGQIDSAVKGINALSANIAGLNSQIRQASAGGAPNALLDQRDQLVSQLSGSLGVSAVTERDGTLSVYTSTGQSLVSGSNSYALSSGNDPYDSSRLNVLDPSGTDVTARLSGGSLGALLNYRSGTLDPAQNRLGQAAIGLASSVNAQQAQGLDRNGEVGKPIFDVPPPAVLPASGNGGSAQVSATVGDASKLTTDDYTLSFNGSDWSLRTRAGQSVPLATEPDGSRSGAGMVFNVSTGAQAGDSYAVQPTRDAAAGLSVALTDPAGVAAASAFSVSPAGGSVEVGDASNPALLSKATVSFPTAGTYAINDASGNELMSGPYAPGQSVGANGWSFTPSGSPAAGDTVAIAPNTDGLNDNSNALSLAGLADRGVLDGGSNSVIASFTQLTTQIGSAGSQAASNLSTQTSLHNQAVAAQQSLSGVNLDEEAANLVRFQQAYQASAQIISAAQSIFSSLLAAVQR